MSKLCSRQKKSYDVQRLAADEGSEVARVVMEDQVEVPEILTPRHSRYMKLIIQKIRVKNYLTNLSTSLSVSSSLARV